MSILPTTILMATDGSEEAQLAAKTAADLAKSTNSELHLIYVGYMPSIFYESAGTMALDRDLHSRMEERAEEAVRNKLDQQMLPEGSQSEKSIIHYNIRGREYYRKTEVNNA